MDHFELISEYAPTGDQPQAIDQLVKGFKEGNQCQTLLGVTGSGKTFTMANVIYMKYLEVWNKKAAIWGASHQGFTLAATTSLGKKAAYIIDSAPFKQGKFAPASHLPIVAPSYFEEHPVDAIVITAPGYTDEIAAVIREKFGSEVEIRAMRSNHLEMV